MRKLLLFVCLTALVSCTEISFKEPQPKGIKKLKSFPSSLLGRYLIPEDSSAAKPDTLEIIKQGYRITGKNIAEDDWLNHGDLGDSLALKKYKEYYFLNFYVEQQWVLRAFKQEKDESIILLEAKVSDEKILESLQSKFKTEIIKVESNTYYQIDPAPNDLLDFIVTNYTPQKPIKKIK